VKVKVRVKVKVKVRVRVKAKVKAGLRDAVPLRSVRRVWGTCGSASATFS